MATATFNHHIRPRPLLATPLPPPRNISGIVFYSAPLKPNKLVSGVRECNLLITEYLPPSRLPSSASRTHFNPSTKLFVSGLSFRTTEESLRNAFENFGELIEENLVMDKIANRPRGFAFLRYAMAEESKKAIEGMHGKFLDGRVIFVEVAKSRSDLVKGSSRNLKRAGVTLHNSMRRKRYLQEGYSGCLIQVFWSSVLSKEVDVWLRS